MEEPMTPDRWLDVLEGVNYLVDEEGVIVALGPTEWNRFAETGGAVELVDGRAAGRSIFDFIAGDEVRRAYAEVHSRLLAGERRHVAFEYRCDSPELSRSMRLAISVMEGPTKRLLYQSQLLSEHVRPPVSLFEAGRATEADWPAVMLCSICQRVEASGTWMSPEAYYRAGGAGEVNVSHGLCGDCIHLLDDEMWSIRW